MDINVIHSNFANKSMGSINAENFMLKSNGYKLSDSLRKKILNEIVSIDYSLSNYPYGSKDYMESEIKKRELMWLMSQFSRFKKFNSFEKLLNNLPLFEKELSSESSFDNSLGYQLLELFNVIPSKIISFEDYNGYGRIVKEKVLGCKGFVSKVLDYILIDGNLEREHKANASPLVDANLNDTERLKLYEIISDNRYDLVEGLYYEA